MYVKMYYLIGSKYGNISLDIEQYMYGTGHHLYNVCNAYV